ncbi:MAG: phosphate ABC transporter substrate-binding protein [Cellulosilyticaceae bacterium]
MKKKLIVAMSILALGLTTLTGCGGASGSKGASKISLVGSTTVAAPMEELAKVYGEKNPDQVIEVQGVGSSAGIKAAYDKTADIGMASRALKEEEKAWNLTETTIAYDGIVTITNPNNPIKNLTTEQVKGIFDGTITNWSEVGGADEQIIVVTREDGSGTRSAFEEILDLKIAPTAIVADGNGAVKASVASKEGAIGYVSLGYVDDTVKADALDGVVPTVESVKAGDYKISRPLLIVNSKEITDNAQQFIDFILGAEGQEILAEKYIPLN